MINDSFNMLSFRMNTSQDQASHFARDILLAFLWLLFLAIVNLKSSYPVVSIFPYVFAVGPIAWRYGMVWGFVFAAIGTLGAMPGGYMKNHDMNDLYWAVFSTYFMLTSVAIGMALSIKIFSRYNHDSQ